LRWVPCVNGDRDHDDSAVVKWSMCTMNMKPMAKKIMRTIPVKRTRGGFKQAAEGIADKLGMVDSHPVARPVKGDD